MCTAGQGFGSSSPVSKLDTEGTEKVDELLMALQPTSNRAEDVKGEL